MCYSKLAVLAAACVGWTQALTQPVQLPLTADAWINYYNPNTNYGAGNYLTAHVPGYKETLLRFDASPVTGRSVASATLWLYVAEVEAPAQVSVRAVTSSWSENTVTFASRPSSESSVAGTYSINTGHRGATIPLDVTSIVQRWSD